ncbi:tRNA pseudouridine(55) synthase TruB [Eilatimonas milleporae]|uniref:tRNA pseudouridine synthase B n=1 Tax=Eilatimonas milleporae TaxID=911205 RepID=A0A3M0C1T1_9PROT|nr:tRNA pseudouridine(55) synthase TruB [Eilatimonas milleporae]RMB02835.1 tRNA pseudouridine synthase B [Eilatimonas milleporae]
MGRRKKGNKVDGWFVLDKAVGQSSAQAVAMVRKAFNAQKAGHAGTLDPLASGILPIALGEATKTVPYLMDADKTYLFDILWGTETDTLDAEGTPTHTGGATPARDAVEAVLSGFTGVVQQVPPAFSALKVDGKRAYALARAGESPDLAARPVRIDTVSLIDHDANAGRSRFQVACGKGTYVRALARDIAAGLGTFGHVGFLRRTGVGPFTEQGAISLEKLTSFGHSARAAETVKPVTTALDDIPALAVTAEEADRLKHGQRLPFPTAETGAVLVTSGGSPVAIAEMDAGVLRPVRVFNL